MEPPRAPRTKQTARKRSASTSSPAYRSWKQSSTPQTDNPTSTAIALSSRTATKAKPTAPKKSVAPKAAAAPPRTTTTTTKTVVVGGKEVTTTTTTIKEGRKVVEKTVHTKTVDVPAAKKAPAKGTTKAAARKVPPAPKKPGRAKPAPAIKVKKGPAKTPAGMKRRVPRGERSSHEGYRGMTNQVMMWGRGYEGAFVSITGAPYGQLITMAWDTTLLKALEKFTRLNGNDIDPREQCYFFNIDDHELDMEDTLREVMGAEDGWAKCLWV